MVSYTDVSAGVDASTPSPGSDVGGANSGDLPTSGASRGRGLSNLLFSGGGVSTSEIMKLIGFVVSIGVIFFGDIVG